MPQLVTYRFTPDATYEFTLLTDSVEQGEQYIRENWRGIITDLYPDDVRDVYISVDPDDIEEDAKESDGGYDHSIVKPTFVVNVHGAEIHVGDVVSPREDDYDLYFPLLDEVFTFDSTSKFTVKAVNWCDDDPDNTLVLETDATEHTEAILRMTFNCCLADDFDVVECAS